MVRGLLIAIAALASAAILWVGGEMHRNNCISSGKQDCTVLPWDQGTTAPKAVTRDWRHQTSAGDPAWGTP